MEYFVSRFAFSTVMMFCIGASMFMVHAPISATSFVEQAKLTATDGTADDFFGYSVALYEDTVIVGAHGVDDEVQGKDIGAAYIFTLTNNQWTQQAKLTASDGEAGDTFGGKVALSDDTAIVGVIRDDIDSIGQDVGSAYVFTRTDKSWSQQAKLVANDATEGDSFGWSIGVSGNIAVIGAPKDDDKGIDSGSVYVFTRSGERWNQTAKLTAQDGTEGDVFGISLALSGNTLIVGADLNEEKGHNAGAVYVFVRSENEWIQQAKLTADDGASGDIFGVRVALDGDTALISARRDDDEKMGVDAGSAYVFTRTGTTWKQQVKLTAPDGEADDRFGRSVALSGETALVGAMFQDTKGENSGSAYVFKRTDSQWHLESQLIAEDGAKGDVFGWFVALAGETAFISANRDDDKGENSGSVYMFEINSN